MWVSSHSPTRLRYHRRRGTSSEPVPALLAAASCPSQVLLWPPLLTQCGARPPLRCFSMGEQELQPRPRSPAVELCGAGRTPQPISGQASLGTPCMPGHPQGSWQHPGATTGFRIPAAARPPRVLFAGASPRPESPAASAGDGRPTIAHKERMSPKAFLRLVFEETSRGRDGPHRTHGGQGASSC